MNANVSEVWNGLEDRPGALDALLQRIGKAERNLSALNRIAAMANHSIRRSDYKELDRYRELLERLNGETA